MLVGDMMDLLYLAMVTMLSDHILEAQTVAQALNKATA
jgi:phosphoribosyl-ATP pyrophosphohydrolase